MKSNSIVEANFTGSHAVVIGSSMAGLLASRVLSDHFEKVTVIERDRPPETPQVRQGVPQGHHAHLLLMAGESVISQLFPGFFDELQAGGAISADASKDVCWFQFGVWKARFKSGFTFCFQSRTYLEWHLRRRLSAYSNVHFLEECDVTGLLSNRDRTHITGVQLKQRNRQQAVEELEADLVVDASGQGSKTSRWIEALGYQKPEETTVAIDFAYASRRYKCPQNFQEDWKSLSIYNKSPFGKRIGGIFPIEGSQWIVTMGGYFGDYPPNTEKGFLDFAHSLEMPHIYEQIKDAEPLTPIYTYKFPASIRRHYERLSSLPEGIVVVGDALCRFNPIYGQGMSVCALEAKTLDTCLREQRQHRDNRDITGLNRQYFQQVSQVIDIPWMMATSEDFRFPQTQGKRPLGTRFLQWYSAQLMELCSTNPTVLIRFLEVLNLLKKNTVLFHPYIVLQVLKWSLGFKDFNKASAERPRLEETEVKVAADISG
jgi:2-polyprenyl-6-methoxyphenol hydroxylase-like FAD-dependent oxidoreductase